MKVGDELVVNNEDLIKPLVGTLLDFERDGVGYRARIIDTSRDLTSLKIVPNTTKD